MTSNSFFILKNNWRENFSSSFHFEQFKKLVAFLLPIFGNVDGSWRATSKLRGSTLIQVARIRSRVFQRFSQRPSHLRTIEKKKKKYVIKLLKNLEKKTFLLPNLGIKKKGRKHGEKLPVKWVTAALSGAKSKVLSIWCTLLAQMVVVPE